MKYKVGDKVRVRNDLETRDGKRYYMDDKSYWDVVIPQMLEMCGKVATISYADSFYCIEEFDCTWTDEMFEGLAEESKFHIYDTVKHEIFGLGTVIGTDGGIAKYKVDFDNLDYSLFVDGHTCYCLPNELTLVEAYTGGEAI